MGLRYNVFLDAEPEKLMACKKCNMHLSSLDKILSRDFRGQYGQAYLMDMVVNVDKGHPSERHMTTGRHIVRDIMCRHCSSVVGWTYDRAYESQERYKEGKFILELGQLARNSSP